jgi:2-keto-4-pentenoate hydratase
MTKAAYALLNARKSGSLVPSEALSRVTDLDSAYAVQREQLALSGEAVAGWKIGATSVAAQKVLGLDGAIFGPICEGAIYASGATVALHPQHGNSLESEFTIRLAQDLPPRDTPYTRAEIKAAVASIHASFELVGCRLESGIAGSGHLVPADFGVNGGAVLGTEISSDHWDTLDQITVTQTIEGDAVQGLGAQTGWAHVFDAVAWLAGQSALMARPLQAGDIVMTGTCTGVLLIKSGQTLHADFGGLAEVSVALT